MTTLSSPLNYNIDDMIFSESQEIGIPDSDMSFKRINIQTKYPDGTVGPLVLGTSRLFSFGVSEETSRETGKVSGYKMPLCCWSRDAATTEELAFTDMIERIGEKCTEYVLEHKDEIEKYDMERSDLKKICSALYWKTEKGKRISGQGPTLYAKLVHYKKDDKFGTTFFNPANGAEIEARDLIGKRCDVKAAIKIDNIYVGRDVRLQIKILEAAVEERSTGKTQWMPRPTVANLLADTTPPVSTPAKSNAIAIFSNSNDSLLNMSALLLINKIPKIEKKGIQTMFWIIMVSISLKEF